MGMSAIFSECGFYRYRLDREVSMIGSVVYGFFGVNGSTAGPVDNDQTVSKWMGFATRNDGARMIVGNPFAYVATDVKELRQVDDPIGPDNDRYLAEIIAEADVLVPCWGDRGKLPRRLRSRLDDVAGMLRASGKPIKCFGVTLAGDPLHPLYLPYSTRLIDWPGM